jgi:hypothetical protein
MLSFVSAEAGIMASAKSELGRESRERFAFASTWRKARRNFRGRYVERISRVNGTHFRTRREARRNERNTGW